MPRHGESRWKQALDIRRAAVKFKDFSTSVATEMVMVSLARDLETGGFARQVDGNQGSFFRQCLHRAIHGGNAQTGHLFARGLEGLVET